MLMVFDSNLDSRLHHAEAVIRYTAESVRPRSVESEGLRCAVALEHYPENMWKLVVDLGMPHKYRSYTTREFGILTDTEQRVVLAFAGGYSDPSSALSLPGASLSGAAVEAVGSGEQQDRFFGRWHSDPTTRAFFAVTEPAFGTNAQLLTSHFNRVQGTVRGTKRFIGNLVNASVGVVFVRIAPSPLGIGAILLELPHTGAEVKALSMLGMRSAGLGELRLNDAKVRSEDVLGMHLPASRRGLWGMTRAFLRMRLQVASMALGAGSALLEEGMTSSAPIKRVDELSLECLALARLVWRCASEADADVRGADVRASLCKAACVEWATRVAIQVGAAYSGSEATPLVSKLVRDIVGLEFMEGVAPKQRQIVAADWLKTKGVKVNGAIN